MKMNISLLRFWIAEGFVGKNQERNAEHTAEEYLMELTNKSLVMVAEKSSDDGIKTCVILIYCFPCACRSVKEKKIKCV